MINIETEKKTVTNNNTSFSPVVVIMLLVVVGAAIFGFKSMTKKSNTTETTLYENEQTKSIPFDESENIMEGEEEAMIDQSEMQIVNVEAGSYYYKPNEIRVKLGDTVKIVMTSVDTMHNFNIDELGVIIPISKNGETSEVEFTADQAGEFEYYCSIGQHRKMGQFGKLIVE